MFIKLTRLDNSPIWFNASFIVTVEPRKGGGTTVVPIGDGLDYDVRETPEAVLSLLAGAPAPQAVAVQSSDALAPTAEDVSPDDSAPIEPVSRWAASKAFGSRMQKFQTPGDEPPPPAAPEAEEATPGESGAKKARKTVRKTRTARAKTEDLPDEATDGAVSSKKKRTTRKAKADTEASEPSVADAPAAPAPESELEQASLDVFSVATSATLIPGLTPDQLSRLRKMMPGSLRKLRNTLDKQFSVAPAYSDEVIDGLVSAGCIAFDRDRVIWQ